MAEIAAGGDIKGLVEKRVADYEARTSRSLSRSAAEQPATSSRITDEGAAHPCGEKGDKEQQLIDRIATLEDELAQATAAIQEQQAASQSAGGRLGALFGRGNARSRGISLPAFLEGSGSGDAAISSSVAVRELEGKVSLLSFQLDRATRARREFEAHLEELKKGSKLGQAGGSQLTQAADLKKYARELEGRAALLLEQNQKLEAGLARSEDELGRERYRVQELTAKVDTSNAKQVEAEKRASELEKERVINIGLRVKTDELVKNKAALETKVAELSSELSSVSEDKHMLEKRAKDLEDQLSAATKSKAELEALVLQLRRDLQDAASEAAAKHVKLNYLQQELVSSGDPLKASIGSMLTDSAALSPAALLLLRGQQSSGSIADIEQEKDEQSQQQQQQKQAGTGHAPSRSFFLGLPLPPTLDGSSLLAFKKNVAKHAKRQERLSNCLDTETNSANIPALLGLPPSPPPAIADEQEEQQQEKKKGGGGISSMLANRPLHRLKTLRSLSSSMEEQREELAAAP